ncbi:putative protein NRT1-PTR FAMILY 2-2 [Nymphaea thermarum]|nr:putative protein NRT1-PTR FAMILY 2-2 [Nymphaea thermarum]
MDFDQLTVIKNYCNKFCSVLAYAGQSVHLKQATELFKLFLDSFLIKVEHIDFWTELCLFVHFQVVTLRVAGTTFTFIMVDAYQFDKSRGQKVFVKWFLFMTSSLQSYVLDTNVGWRYNTCAVLNAICFVLFVIGKWHDRECEQGVAFWLAWLTHKAKEELFKCEEDYYCGVGAQEKPLVPSFRMGKLALGVLLHYDRMGNMTLVALLASTITLVIVVLALILACCRLCIGGKSHGDNKEEGDGEMRFQPFLVITLGWKRR